MKVGVVGVGHWGRNLLRNFHSLGALGALTDADSNALHQAEGEYPQASSHTSFESLVADTAIRGVVIATPPATHGRLVRDALEADKHVFVEKPLCLDVTEAQDLN